VPFAAKVILELFKKIVAGSEPRPSTLIALLNQMVLPSAIGVGLKTNSIELNSVHQPALPVEDDPLESEDRSDTTEGDLTARFATALVTALF
jgi:hypothetical protein